VREAKDLALEDQYSRKTPLEHVLLRPSMYVGSNEKAQPIACWVPDPIPTPPTEELLMKPTSVVQYATVPDYPIKMVRLEYGLVPALNKVRHGLFGRENQDVYSCTKKSSNPVSSLPFT
jgi:hypothetical protein